MPLSSLIAIAILKQFLILSIFFKFTFMRLVATFVISETLLEEFCFEKTGIAKRREQEQESDFLT
jgi:hypothetical protein